MSTVLDYLHSIGAIVVESGRQVYKENIIYVTPLFFCSKFRHAFRLACEEYNYPRIMFKVPSTFGRVISLILGISVIAAANEPLQENLHTSKRSLYINSSLVSITNGSKSISMKQVIPEKILFIKKVEEAFKRRNISLSQSAVENLHAFDVAVLRHAAEALRSAQGVADPIKFYFDSCVAACLELQLKPDWSVVEAIKADSIIRNQKALRSEEFPQQEYRKPMYKGGGHGGFGGHKNTYQEKVAPSHMSSQQYSVRLKEDIERTKRDMDPARIAAVAAAARGRAPVIAMDEESIAGRNVFLKILGLNEQGEPV